METLRLKYLALAVLFLPLVCCQHKEKKDKTEKYSLKVQLSLQKADSLAALPLACIQQEYPNKLGQTLGNSGDLAEPKVLHPAFYGCFDWHSAVHGHWALIRLLRLFPDLENAEMIRKALRDNLSRENLAGEMAYFQREMEKGYERTYGWGWLLKLAGELRSWDDPFAKELEQNVRPLADLLTQRLIEYLPKLQYPIRVGTHTNTAFALGFAYDYSVAVGNGELQKAIADRATAFFIDDTNCPLAWEPSGSDFLSPCFEEVDLMRRVLDKERFLKWMHRFMPALSEPDFDMDRGRVGDREDGQLVHLDGLNFSRAWVFYGLAKQYPEKYGHLKALGDAHMAHSFPSLFGDHYEGGHWLGSFAIYALGEQ